MMITHDQLDALYNGQRLTQASIAKMYGVSQVAVFLWMKKHNIKSRAHCIYQAAPSDERFHASYEKTKDGCWNWARWVNERGYGIFKPTEKTKVSAHRRSFELANGKIPAGLVIDHMCRNRRCVNPAHLRAVTPRVNALENSVSPCAKNKQKTHCIRGHELSGDNLRLANGWRLCISCERLRYVPVRERREQNIISM